MLLREIEERFPVGSTVRLKGINDCPPMAVDAFPRLDGAVAVLWFDTNRHLHRDAFLPEQLVSESEMADQRIKAYDRARERLKLWHVGIPNAASDWKI